MATVYLVDIDGCGLLTIESYRASETDAIALVNTLRCSADRTTIEGAPPDGYRELAADELSGTSQTIVNLTTMDGRYLGAFAVTSGQSTMTAPDLLVARGDLVETLDIGGHQVHRARVGANLVHVWYVDGASVAIASPSMSDSEVEALIAGSRVVGEAEWQAWAASVDH